MEFRLNKEHRVIITNAGEAMITRLALNGGKPRTITIELDPEVSFRKAMDSVTRIADLDDYMFDLLVESLKVSKEGCEDV